MGVDCSKRKGDFWITGSQVFRLMKNVSESLAGRVGIVNLLGLSDAEIYQEPSEPYQTDAARLMNRLSVRSRKGLNEIYYRIFKGSMPELYADENVDWETYYRSYVDTYLQRDIRDLAQVADEMQFYNFMTIVAAQTMRNWQVPRVFRLQQRKNGFRFWHHLISLRWYSHITIMRSNVLSRCR